MDITSVKAQLDNIYNTRYTDPSLPNRFLIKAYGVYLSGSYCKEGMDYHFMNAHFELDTNCYDGNLSIWSCDQVWHIQEDGTFKEII